MEKAWAIIIDDDQAACMMAIPRLFEQLRSNFNLFYDYAYLKYGTDLWLTVNRASSS
ncbi:hypothetical protein [Endozoicomonas atrinae]|uniref:hypothetical protein n=1 Tax=Endozoicomonas atrinae TaxID=1333660 RepID=UPI003B0068E7